MRLPDGKTAVLYSVYEAVSNSIHAISDRFGEDLAAKNGRVDVDITLAEDGDVDSISITDNGIGFTPENIQSFETSDSRFKYQRGGKGVGRKCFATQSYAIRHSSINLASAVHQQKPKRAPRRHASAKMPSRNQGTRNKLRF